MSLSQTTRICLIALIGGNGECVAEFARVLADLGHCVEVLKLPSFFLSELTSLRLRLLRELVRSKAENSFVIFFPDSTELFLKEPDFTLSFSAYSDWFDPDRMRVIPHLWTPVRLPAALEPLLWREKPPLHVGFMGRSHATSRLASIVMRSPGWFRDWCLRGYYLRRPKLIANMNSFGFVTHNLNTFPRIEAMNALKAARSADHKIKITIVERQSFGGTENEIRDYKEHLERSTYIICPRGSENYSYRMYEALCFGRVPVIVDTRMVLAPEIDWPSVAVVVPYESMDRVVDYIEDDYNRRSEVDFRERQQRALSRMRELNTLNWIRECAKDLPVRGAGRLRA